MTNITYQYTVINVDAAARCMEIVYTSVGRQTMHVSARLPYVGEDLEQVIKMYAPVSYWIEQETEVAVPQVGAGGTLVHEPVVSPQAAPATQP